ncbi:MAG: hypothetical protein KDA42_04420 [Planctomycetales bacterium]|nr:hypothetical protein [Planctomycetales bacterium]
MYPMQLSFKLTFCLLTLLMHAGCNSQSVGQVAGKVTLGSQPLTGHMIIFENDQGVSVSANLAADGSYTLRTSELNGLPPGEYKIAIRPGNIGTGEAPLVGGPEENSAAPEIPTLYHNSATSGLSATVNAGANEPFDFVVGR